MATLNNGVLFIEALSPTQNVGEYTFENAVYTTQTDPTGGGAYSLETNYVIFTPVIDLNTFINVPGTLNRYLLTELTIINQSLISGKIIFDEEGEETYPPGNNMFCIITKPTVNKRLAIPTIDVLYTDLVNGSTVAAMLNDLVNILDKSTGGGGGSVAVEPVLIPIETEGQVVFELPYRPAVYEATVLIVNGLLYTYGVSNDYHIVNRALYWNNTSFSLIPSDSMVFR